jgi:DNA modification methylase
MKQELNQCVTFGDALQHLEKLPPECIDLTIADPPFNIGYKYDEYDDKLSPDEYLFWSETWHLAGSTLDPLVECPVDPGTMPRVIHREAFLELLWAEDPFAGTATTAVVAKKLGRFYITYELGANFPDAVLVGGWTWTRIQSSQFDLHFTES